MQFEHACISSNTAGEEVTIEMKHSEDASTPVPKITQGDELVYYVESLFTTAHDFTLLPFAREGMHLFYHSFSTA